MKDTADSARAVRVLWLAVAVVASAGWFAGPVIQWHSMVTICHTDASCQSWQLDARAAGTLSQHGLSPLAVAIFTMTVLVVCWLIWYGLGALLIFRSPNDRGALLAAFFLALFPLWADTAYLPSSELTSLASGGFVGTLLLFGLLFPDGHFAPPWTRWLVTGIAAVAVLPSVRLPSPLNVLGNVLLFTMLVAVIAAQVHRYRTISSWGQRQQTKWGITGLAIAIVGLVTIWVIASVAPFPTGSGSLWLALTSMSVIVLIASAIPVFVGISVLRNRLWDIDRIINRALVYTVFTVLLAGIYIGSVVGLQALFGLMIGGGSTLAIALSTLAIAALFGPLRRRVQAVIDRRFYRRKYDAAKTLTSFTTRLRDEVDLAHLEAAIISVVADTMQPAHVSLWLAGEPRQRQL